MIDFLKDTNYLLFDGAMGTYFAEYSGDIISSCEFANIEAPHIIKNIHNEYIHAGAKAIRTNTFSANTLSLNVDFGLVTDIIIRGFNLAKEAAVDNDVLVFADIGPIPQIEEHDTKSEYKKIVDVFLTCHAENFIFETFSETDALIDICEYIKSKNPNAFILAQFAISPDGYTRKGVSGEQIIHQLESFKHIDAFGFNCNCGPTHLYNYIKKVNIKGKTISIMPNSGYPEIINERTVFSGKPEYFAQIMSEIKGLGVKIIGGCCGTTPKHICETAKLLEKEHRTEIVPCDVDKKEIKVNKINNHFKNMLDLDKKVIAVELDPPANIHSGDIIHSAKLLKNHGANIITISDNALSRPRADSSIIASKIQREVGIEVLPHLACRDKNLNALNSLLLGLHIEGVRNILAVTGDPITEAQRKDVKAVFNLNSFMLADFTAELNQTEFKADEMHIGGAVNINAKNFDFELKRTETKSKKGMKFFLTQPIFDETGISNIKRLKEELNVKVLAGIFPLVSFRNANYLNNEVPGIHIPNEIIQRFINKSRAEAQIIGINIAVELSKKVAPFVDGFYIITPFNRALIVCEIIDLMKSEGEILV
jgi:methionine synthase I (cobalamin-dependent)/5,10-methylenetetrahydrofolate reductase